MKVIVAVENTSKSRDMINEVAKRKWPQDTFFKILTVLPRHDRHIGFGDGQTQGRSAMVEETEAERKEDAEQMCSSMKQKLSQNIPCSLVHFEIRHGCPKNEIVTAAGEWGADKILLGGDTTLSFMTPGADTIFRSVAKRVDCSVDVVITPVLTPVQKDTVMATSA